MPLKKPKNYLSARCKRNGITEELFRRLLHAQDGRCAICVRKFNTHRRPSIDCDKDTVRGLLCDDCYAGIQSFNNSVIYLRSAVAYVTKNHDTDLLPAHSHVDIKFLPRSRHTKDNEF